MGVSSTSGCAACEAAIEWAKALTEDEDTVQVDLDGRVVWLTTTEAALLRATQEGE